MRDQVCLDLKTVDICFLAGLYLRADQAGLASFEEDILVDMFEQTCDLVELDADNPRKRATHAIQRLRDQHMLARIDGAGIVRAGEYALTRLAVAVIEYFLTNEALTRESLTLLTATLRAQLVDVLAVARKAENNDQWHAQVIAPLRVTVGDLIAGIERRQRGLDAQQEEVQAEIASLLTADWFLAVDQCQGLLDATTTTLRELNDVLLRDTHHFLALLQDIQARAASAMNREAEEAAQRVIEHVDRIVAWGGARQRAWSDYYQYVHRYLREVVRLDPDRALSQRLRDQIVGWPARPFYHWVVSENSICLLRPLEVHVERPPVLRPRVDREAEPDLVDAENAMADIDRHVIQALEQGCETLASVTDYVLDTVSEDAQYAAIGRIADALVRLGAVRSERERPWRTVHEQFEIEDWAVQQSGEEK